MDPPWILVCTHKIVFMSVGVTNGIMVWWAGMGGGVDFFFKFSLVKVTF